MFRFISYLLLPAAFLSASARLCAQVKPASAQRSKDSMQEIRDRIPKKKTWIGNIFQQAYNSIENKNPMPEDSINNGENALLNAKSEDAFRPYEGKIIRRIYVNHLGFDRTFIDTARRVTNFISKAAATLHVNTKPWVVFNHLFIREGVALNPYLLADNERFLRTLEFIQDSRIIVHELRGRSGDSVDVEVITRDLFTIKAVADGNMWTDARLRLSENNFLGMGQRIQGTFLYDTRREPRFGYEALYRRSSIGGSFFNGTIAYNNIGTARNIGREREEAVYLNLEHPLMSPFARFAGGMEVSINRARNFYHKPDTAYFNYGYSIFDIWGGLNLGVKRLLANDSNYRDRRFLGLRYFDYDFNQVPYQVGDNYDFIYNSRRALLASITFFRQEFIKTQYIYNFGVTEDMPYGYNVSATVGWWEQLDRKRPYAGLDMDYFTAERNGGFHQYFLRSGGFYHGNKIEDAVLLAGANYFSPAYKTAYGSRTRIALRASYTRLFDRLTIEPMRINNQFYGLRYYTRDSAIGDRRLSLQSEAAVYLKTRWHGFRFAPFVYADFVLLTPEGAAWRKPVLYPGIGGGVRTRNQNLIFGTIEFRGIYLPKTQFSSAQFKIDINTDLRYFYNTEYVHSPRLVRYNTDRW